MINYCIIHKCEDKSVVLVDFFDTVMFRHIHSHQMMGNWAKALVRKYPELDEKKLVEYTGYCKSTAYRLNLRKDWVCAHVGTSKRVL